MKTPAVWFIKTESSFGNIERVWKWWSTEERVLNLLKPIFDIWEHKTIVESMFYWKHVPESQNRSQYLTWYCSVMLVWPICDVATTQLQSPQSSPEHWLLSVPCFTCSRGVPPGSPASSHCPEWILPPGPRCLLDRLYCDSDQDKAHTEDDEFWVGFKWPIIAFEEWNAEAASSQGTASWG